MVFGWQLPGARLNLPRILKTDGTSSGLRAVFGYGVAYAVAALSCSLALLLAVVAQAVSTGSLAGLWRSSPPTPWAPRWCWSFCPSVQR